jgi:amino acid transporter
MPVLLLLLAVFLLLISFAIGLWGIALYNSATTIFQQIDGAVIGLIATVLFCSSFLLAAIADLNNALMRAIRQLNTSLTFEVRRLLPPAPEATFVPESPSIHVAPKRAVAKRRSNLLVPVFLAVLCALGWYSPPIRSAVSDFLHSRFPATATTQN